MAHIHGNSNGNSEDWHRFISIDYFLIHVLAPLLNRRLFRVGIYIFFALIFTGSIILFPTIDTETDVTKFVPDDSFILDFLDVLDEGFGEVVYEAFDLIVQNRDFSELDTRNEVSSMINYMNDESDDASKYGFFIQDLDQWVFDFDDWFNETYNQSINHVDISQTDYYRYLKEFTNLTQYQQWQTQIVFDDEDDPTEIVATKFTTSVQYSVKLTERWWFAQDIEEQFDDKMGDSKSGYGFAIGIFFGYLAQAIVSLTINNLIFALLGVFIVLAILMDIRMALFISVLIATIDVDLLGWMALNNVALDTLAYGQLVMSVGLTVDYIIHIAHAITDAEPTDPNDYTERLTIAFHDMGVGVAKGALTTFLGILTLIFSQSEAFRVFFVMFCGIIIIAVLHGFLLTPALLAETSFFYHSHLTVTPNFRQNSIRTHGDTGVSTDEFDMSNNSTRVAANSTVADVPGGTGVGDSGHVQDGAGTTEEDQKAVEMAHVE